MNKVDGREREMTGQTGITEHEHCLAPGCGRRLTSTVSRSRGYGHGCWRKLRAVRTVARVVLAEVYTPEQLDKADELIEDGALVPTGIEGLFLAVSSDGEDIYTTTEGECNCPASKPCCHRAAATMALAA
jgi:Family of unknown function (DUF6011)